MTDYAIRVEDLSFAEDFGCNHELVEYFTNFFNLVQTQSDTRLNIKEAVSFGLIRKKRQISAASYFYKVYDLKETSDKTSSIKASVNCCPMENILEPLEWGHEKEISTVKLYFKLKLYLYCALFTHSRWLSILRVRIAL